MTSLPISFPSERERQRRLIDDDRGLSFRERVQSIDELLALIDSVQMSDESRAHRASLELAEYDKKQRGLREFLRQQLAQAQCRPPTHGSR
jgi:hypothetical protein